MASSSPSPYLRWLPRLMLAVGLLPAVQTALNMKFLRPTQVGFDAALPRPALSWHTWWEGSLQPALEAYAAQRIGLREWLVKPRNQLLYSGFQETTNTQVLRGKHGMLFEAGVVQGALGRVPQVDEARVTAQVHALRAVQDTLARRGKLLVYVMAPNKAALYPENLPDSCRQPWSRRTAYEQYRGPMKAAGINLLDLAALFQAWKPHSPYPLFSSGGTHWSGYGATRAADTLWRYLEARGHFRLPRVRQVGLEVGKAPRYSDDDLVRLLNLWYAPAPAPPLAYPTLAFDPPLASQRRPSLLLVADSFGYSFIYFYPYLQHLFAPNSTYWYYNHEVVWTNTDNQKVGPTNVDELDLRTELATHDVVLLLFNTVNLIEFDHGFSERATRILAENRH